MNPVTAEYVVGSPIFDKVEVKFPHSDQTLTINANGARDRPYVKSLSVDQNKIEKPILTHETLLSINTLNFEMSDTPQSWGKNAL